MAESMISLPASFLSSRRSRPVWYSAMAWRVGPGDFDMTFGLGTLRCLAGFFAGVSVNLLWRACRSRIDAMRPMLGMAEIPVVLLAFGFVAVAGGNHLSFAAPFVFGALVFCFAAEAGIVSRCMNNAAFRLIGDLSYSIYMTALLVALMFGRGVVAVAGRLGHDIAYETKAVGETFEVFGFRVEGGEVTCARVFGGRAGHHHWRYFALERIGARKRVPKGEVA